MLTIAQALETLGLDTTRDIVDKAMSDQELQDTLDELDELLLDNSGRQDI